jgi:uncharacterized membrane protein YbaN (DUF454 family)
MKRGMLLLILSFSYNVKIQTTMNKFKKIGILIIGWFFLVLGILGLFLPILQGILFIMIGLAILSSRSASVRLFLRRFEKRYPHLHERMTIWRSKITKWFK